MQLDKDTLKKLLELDDETFRKNVKAAAVASGIDEGMIERMIRDTASIKKTLAGIDEDQIKRAATIVGTNKIEDLLKNLKDNMKP